MPRSDHIGSGVARWAADSSGASSARVIAQGRNHLLDAVRGVAILLILYYHLFRQAFENNLPWVAKLMGLSWTGVDLFFILSGYLLGGILIRNRNSKNYYRTFYGRRFLRILVPYWIAIALLFLTVRAPGSPWMYLTFTQNIVWAVNNDWGPIFILPTWSLAVEEQFYLVLPLLIRLCPPKRLPYVLVALFLAAPACRLLSGYYVSTLASYILPVCRMDSLFLGVMIAWAMHTQHVQEKLLAHLRLLWAIIAATGAFILYALAEGPGSSNALMTGPGYSIVALFYGAVMTVLLVKKIILPRSFQFLTWFGLGAYSLYLFHLPIERQISPLFGPHITGALAIVGSAIIIAAIVWRYIEAPLIRVGHRIFQYN